MPDDVTIPLKRTPLWSSNLTLLSAVAAAFTLNTLMDIGPQLFARAPLDAEAALSLGVMLVALLSLVGTVVKRAIVRSRPLRAIRMGEHTMRLPVHPESLRHHEVPYSAIIAVGEGGRPPRKHFFIESGRRIYHLPQEMFADATGPQLLFAALKGHLQSLPMGTQQLVMTERERRDALKAMGVRPMVTHALLGINGVFFLNTWLKGALDVPFGLLRWGANAPALVYRGELYRLASANFLHGHWLHMTMNMLALWYLGSLMERLLGWARFSVLYLSAGAIAMAASAYFAGAVLTVGASGAIFGLLGGFAVISLRLRKALPMGVRQTPRWWVSMILVNTCIPLLWPVVDSAAHIAGFIVGALISLALLGRGRRLPGKPSKPLVALACIILAVYGAALAQAVVCAANTTASQEVRFGKLLLADTRTPAATLNTLAWLWMADPASTQEHLLAAQDACLAAVAKDPTVPEFHATLGMVCQRLKNDRCATDAWYAAMNVAYSAKSPAGIMRNDGGVPALYAYQYARVLEQELQRIQDEATALPLTRYRDTWTVVLPPNTPLPAVALILGTAVGDSAVALVQWRLPATAQASLTLPEDLNVALLDAGVRQARMVFPRSLPHKNASSGAQAMVKAPGANAPEPLVERWAMWRLPASNGDDSDTELADTP